MSLYLPPHFSAGDRAAIARIVDEHPFATLVTPVSPEPLVTHLPLIHVADSGPHGTLLGHFARANPHWQAATTVDSIAIFHGPHAYVSPSWYGEPAAAVPTWNYAVVHVHGSIELTPHSAETREVLDRMVDRFESARPAPWRLGLDGARLDAMLSAIVGFRFRIKRIDAKFKMSQNRSADDRNRVAAALDAEPHADAAATAAWMRACMATTPDGKA